MWGFYAALALEASRSLREAHQQWRSRRSRQRVPPEKRAGQNLNGQGTHKGLEPIKGWSLGFLGLIQGSSRVGMIIQVIESNTTVRSRGIGK